ncbi:major capsid protein [Thalassobaculum sp.]|uniref:major capsid protein n=1 Tax=Thalassobaculum sp. TaxID=2022740 RepID=UPI0032EDA62B
MSTQMTPAQSRVVDPILSNHVRGYTNQEYVGRVMAPRVDVGTRGFRVIKFDRDSFKNAAKAPRRAPGAAIPRVQFGFQSDPIALYQEALAGQVPIENQEEAAAVPGIDLQMNTAATTMDIIQLREEVETSQLLTDPANYGADNKLALVGTDKWNNDASKPKEVINEAREQIRLKIGRYPNRAIISPGAFNALDQHPLIRDQFKYTSSESLSEAMIARYFGLDQVKIGKAVYVGDDDVEHDCWDNCMVLGFVHGAANPGMPAFSYTYGLRGYPLARAVWWDANTESWVGPVLDERRPYIVGADAGFLIQTPV